MLTNTKKFIILPCLILVEVFTIAPLQASTASLAGPPAVSAMIGRQAVRLQKRLERRDMGSVSLSRLEAALQKRRRLLQRRFALTIQGSDGAELVRSDVSLSQFPLWIEAKMSFRNLQFQLSPESIAGDLASTFLAEVPVPIDAEVRSLVAGDMLRVETDAIAKAGYSYDVAVLAEGILAELEGDEPEAFFTLEHRPGRMTNITGSELGPLVHLVTGRSNFDGSGLGRIANVRKGMHERIHNIVIPPRETFSFNDAIGPMYARDGWQEALGIFNGNELRPVRGGGICQVATTVYRAAVHYGFPVVERKNHSLYVSYYEAHGVGIDATVFRGSQDLRFVNDTGSPLLLQAYTDGFEAYVSVYGAPDGRSVALKGPFFASTGSPEEFRGKELRSNEIGWVQEITYADGRTHENVIVSRYRAIPRSLPAKYASTDVALQSR